jgi:hypothetical protein
MPNTDPLETIVTRRERERRKRGKREATGHGLSRVEVGTSFAPCLSAGVSG